MYFEFTATKLKLPDEEKCIIQPHSIGSQKEEAIKKSIAISIIFYFLVFNFSLLIFYEQRRRSLF